MASYSNATRLIVALGASNTAGYGVGAEYAYPKCIERLLRKRHIAAEVVNSGVSGNTTGEMLARLERVVPAGTCPANRLSGTWGAIDKHYDV
jgi:acyl-CoA thioesterase-1